MGGEGGSLVFTSLGAVLVMASLFGFGLLAQKIFVTRNEFEAFKASIEERLQRIEGIIDARFTQMVGKIDSNSEALARLMERQGKG